jgi:rhamnosyltransferase
VENIFLLHEGVRKPRFAILLAVYNGMQYAQEQLDSILGQRGVEVEIFVSVDKSSDGSESWIDAQAILNPQIHVLPHGEVFGGAAPNFFRLIEDVDFSTFDFMALADQDDVWLPNKLYRAQRVLSESTAEAYSSNVTAFWEGGKTSFINKAQPQVDWDFLFEAAGPGCTYVLKASLATEIQRFIIKNPYEITSVGLHDWFIYAYARSRAYRWVIDQEALILYRQHSQNQVGANAGLKGFISRARKVSSGWALAQSALIARLIGLDDANFVKTWINGGRPGLLKLSLSFWECRRRTRDKFIFLFSCLYMALFGMGK